MVTTRCFVWIGLVGAAVIATGCGGGDTTIIQTVAPQTVTQTAPTAPGTGKVLLPDVATTRAFEQPTTYAFSADGDLMATGLQWAGWGQPNATATGTFTETEHPSGRKASYDGTVTAMGLVPCGGTSYYTGLEVKLPPDALFQPQGIPVYAPCGE